MPSSTPAPAVDSLIQKARQLAPTIRELGGEIEQGRTLPRSLVTALADSGFFSLWLTRSSGGYELTPTDFIRVIEELSRADGSVGWCAMIAAAYSRFSGFLAEDTAREIFRDGRTVIAGSLGPTGRAVAVPGGFRLSGHWSYGSFIQHSQWTVGGAVVHDGDAPRLGANGAPDVRFLFFPTSEAEIIDNWHVSGLRGTGSHDYRVHNLFVPENRVVSPFTAKPLHAGALYAAPTYTLIIACLAAVPLGIARAAIDAFVALAEAKTPMTSRVRLCEKPKAQIDVGRAEAVLRAGRAFLFEAIEELWKELEGGRAPSMRQRALVRLAVAHATAASTQAVDLVYEAAGGTALFETTPIERCFRDVHATTQHIGTSSNNYEAGGRVMLGLEWGPAPL
jgi:alkylation response protein AidB-like acyl-CoA dehydrogenase